MYEIVSKLLDAGSMFWGSLDYGERIICGWIAAYLGLLLLGALFKALRRSIAREALRLATDDEPQR